MVLFLFYLLSLFLVDVGVGVPAAALLYLLVLVMVQLLIQNLAHVTLLHKKFPKKKENSTAILVHSWLLLLF